MRWIKFFCELVSKSGRAVIILAAVAFALFAEDYRWARSAVIAVCTACATITGLMLFTGYHLN